jgi:hypothetical protein
MLRNALPVGTQLPGVDYKVGNLLPTSSLVNVKTAMSGDGWTYYPDTDLVRIWGNNVTVSGIDFGSAEVMVWGNNVTLKNCTFEPSPTSLNWYSIIQYGTGAIVENCTLTGPPVVMRQGGIYSTTAVTIRNNVITNSAGDAIDVEGGATVTGNYISGGGFSGAHSDGVWVTDTKGVPTTVTNNFIEFLASDSGTNANNTIRITAEKGKVSNLTVSGNYLLGGAYSVSVGANPGDFSNVNFTGNYIGFSLYGSIYPWISPDANVSGNTTFDWRNTDYSTNAWNAYSASLGTDATIVASIGNNINNTLGQYETLYGAGFKIHIGGGKVSGTNLVGGFGRQFLDLNSGSNIVTYLSVSDSSAMSGIDAVTGFTPMRDIFDLSPIDANTFAAGQQSFSYIGTAAFSGTGAQVRYYQDPSTNLTFVEAKLAGDTSADLTIAMSGLYTLSASNFALTPAQSAAAVAAAKALKVANTQSNGVYESNYTGVIGKTYADYQTFWLGGKLAAMNTDYGTAGAIWSNGLEIAQTGVTLTRSSSPNDILKIGAGTFALPVTRSEFTTIDAGASATINLQKGFRPETIYGFDLTSSSPDTLNLSKAMFSYALGNSDSTALAAVIRSRVSRRRRLMFAANHSVQREKCGSLLCVVR